ncbi:MAG: DUF4215 domain-containing protein [Candidatus Binatia bacterium]
MPPLRTSLVLILALLMPLPGVTHAAPFAYFSNLNADTVSVLDTATDTIVATVPIHQSPFGVAFPVGQPIAYLLSAGGGGTPTTPSGRVHVLDAATNTVTNIIETGGGPSVSLAVNPIMARIYVANFFPPFNVAVIDSDAQTLLTNVPTWAYPTMVAVHPSGDRAYVVSQGGSTGIVQVLDTATNTIVRTVDIGGPAFGVAFNPGGDRAYFTHGCESACPFATGAVDVLDTATETVLARIEVGELPRGITVDPSGTHVYVANSGDQNGGTVSVISAAANAVIDTIAVGPRPWSVAVHPDGSKLYAVSNGAGMVGATVAVIDLAARDGGTTIPLTGATQARGTFMTPVVVPAGCSDGVTGVGEACDDGNVVDGDGCDHDCSVTACGNGITSPGEECDDDNTADADDCSSACARTGCGDGLMTAGEECDDGNISDADACSSACVVTPCGDGLVTAGERCDDGNTTASDGCDAGCQLELIPGGGKANLDCAVQWAVANGTTPPRFDSKGRPSPKQTCRDGDVRCDRDAVVNGSCTFGVQICFGIPNPACFADVTQPYVEAEIVKPSLIDAGRSPAAAAVRAQLGGVLASYLPGGPNVCTSRIDMVVPMRVTASGFHKHKLAWKTRVMLYTKGYDTDSLQLVCVQR